MFTILPQSRLAWRGPSLLVTDARGMCSRDHAVTGFYHHEARHLSVLRLLVNGEDPWLCEFADVAPNRLDLTFNHPELQQFGGGGSGEATDERSLDAYGIEFRSLDLQLSYIVRVVGLDIALRIGNRTQRPAQVQITWNVAADFADIQEALDSARQQNAEVRAEPHADLLRLVYAHPDLLLSTEVRGGGDAEWSVACDHLRANVRLNARESSRLTLEVRAIDGDRAITPDDERAREGRVREWHERTTSVTIPGNPMAAEVVRRSAEDLASLALLEDGPDEWLAPQAGVPLYPAFFGRDALTSGWQAGMLDQCDTLLSSLTKAARHQGTRADPWRDEEPGRIVQQIRRGPIARLGRTPFDRYYGDFASPLMFVVALATRYAWRGDDAELAALWDAARRIVDWVRDYGDRDGDGYLEYQTRSGVGPENQGWKDSGDAMIYEDGTPMPSPLAACEIQGYWYAAQQLMAGMCLARGEISEAKAFWRAAKDLKERFNRDWWLPDDQFIALAKGRDGRMARTIASNAGHCLTSGIIDDDHLPAVVGRLFAPDLFSGWGIRTLSTDHPRYNPLSYHRGSVWLVENATIAFGLRRFGFDARALELAGAMFELAGFYDRYRVPEAIGGYARGERPSPGAYPRANPLQAWNASAMPLFLQTILGLQPLARLDLLVADPVLPAWLPSVRLTGLRVGGASATLHFWRDEDGTSHVAKEHVRGTLHVVRQPPLESLAVGWGERIRSLVTRVR